MTRLLGLGRVVHDAHWRRGVSEMQYLGSRGGGSVWNILANAAALGVSTAAIGVSGDDERADVALADNASLGIDTVLVERIDGRVTSTMHHFPRPGSGDQTRYQTSSLCQRCQSRPEGPRLIQSARISAGPRPYELAQGTLVVDQLSRLAADWARQLRSDGWATAIDIGYAGYLRFSSAATLESHLREFGLIVVQARVANFLEEKLRGSIADIARQLRSVVLVSDGEKGLLGWDARDGEAHGFSVPAPICEVVDTVGAGDALLGGILGNLALSHEGVNPLRAATWDGIEAACQRSMESIPDVLASVGARGHLPGAMVSLSGSQDGALGATCAICGAPTTRLLESSPVANRAPRVSAPLAERNLLRRRTVLEALAQPSPALDSARELIDNPKNTVVTGTGGSFPAACAIARLLNDAWGRAGVSSPRPLAVAMRPLDVLRGGASYDQVVGVSYSGGTGDVQQALSLASSGGAETWLITGGIAPYALSRPPVQTKVIGYGFSAKGSARRRESGFVSFVGAAAPLVLLLAATESIDRVQEVIRSTRLSLQAQEAAALMSECCGPRGEGGLAVIGTGWSEAAILDIESKFVEGGLAPIAVHDSKDFSHGRFQSLSLKPAVSQAVLLLRVGEETPYEQLLARVIRKELGEPRVAELATQSQGALGMLECLLAAQVFSVRFGSSRSVDISKPSSVGRSWLQLYKWDQPLLGDDEGDGHSREVTGDGFLF